MNSIRINHPFRQPAFVYRIYTRDDQLLYIGSTLHIHQRLADHGYNAEWFYLADRMDYEEYPDLAAARVVEQAAVEAELPPGNVRWTPRHRGNRKAAPFVPPAPRTA